MEEIFGKYENFEYRERKPSNNLVENIGINDSPFVVQPTCDGKRVTHPAYQFWQNMLVRCYNPKYKEKNPTYVGVTCCEEWLLFTNFAKWFKGNYIEGYHLDKDLLVKDNKIYSPSTCIFVPPEINIFIILSDKSRGSLPLGVTSHREKFRAKIRKDGVMKHLGIFSDPLSAHKAWQKAKLEQAISFNFPHLQRVIDQLKYEIENNLETTSL